jgi:hypothetical protein
MYLTSITFMFIAQCHLRSSGWPLLVGDGVERTHYEPYEDPSQL